MTCFLRHLTFQIGLGILSLAFAAQAKAAMLPKDGQSFRIEIPAGAASAWLGAKPKQGEISFTKSEATAVRWRFHLSGDGSYTIESLEDGRRWLTLDPDRGLRLAYSNAALASHWQLSLVDDQLQMQSQSSYAVNTLLVFAVDSAQLVDKNVTPYSNLILHEQPEQSPILNHGDIISIRSMAANEGALWLDGNTTNGVIALINEAGMYVNSGSIWRVHDNGDGSFSFECLGNVPGRRWLSMAGPTPTLASTNDRNEATHWKVSPSAFGTLTFKNVTYKTKTPWLDTYPQIASTAMAEVTTDTPGAFFQIRIRSPFDPRLQGRWSDVESLPASGIHTHLLPNGKVLFWSRFMDPTDVAATVEGIVPGKDATFLYDPDTGLTIPTVSSAVDSFCSGHAFLPDGRLLVTGGHIRSYVGPKSTQIYDYRSGTWTTSPDWDMNQGRWYPTNASLGNGDIITISGDATSEDDPNRIPQVWSSSHNRWRDLTGLASSCFNSTSGPCMPLYPWLHLAPNGRVFVSGPGQETGYIDTDGIGTWTPVARTNRGYRGDYEATSIMYAPGKILIAGGLPVTRSVETIDLNQAIPRWKVGTPMLYARRKLTSTLLADGQVFVSGGLAADGNSDAPSVYSSEIWNPETGLWTEADHIRIPRLYHSSAILLPDGRVLSLGGGLGAGFTAHKNLQIFSPPYLFKGPRPSFTTQATLGYGQTFRITSPDSDSIAKVHLIRLSSDTHSFNSTQLIVPMDFTVNRRSIAASVPSDNNLAPPGFYLLFLVNRSGVPSLGKMVQLIASRPTTAENGEPGTTRPLSVGGKDRERL